MILLAIGAISMRAAGCIFNDWVDRDIDGNVERTKDRPLASGTLPIKQAFLFAGILCAIGACVLLFLHPLAWVFSFIGAFLLAIYPFMKRITRWPQVVLGLAFNIGIWVGAACIFKPAEFPVHLLPLSLLYCAGIFWTIGYDTIYALQDIDDDRRLGIHSTAITFGRNVVTAVKICYTLFFILLFATGFVMHASAIYFLVIASMAAFTARLLYDFSETSFHGNLFRLNKWLGLGVFIALCVAI